MDWLRSCYQSEWRLFADDPGILTPGRYYFSPEKTPFVAAYHFYGSRVWYDANYPTDPPLGEPINIPHSWDNGQAPVQLPRAEAIGDVSQFAIGGNVNSVIDSANMANGFPIACYAPRYEVDPDWELVSELENDPLKFFYSTLIKWMYEKKKDRIDYAFKLLLKKPYDFEYVEGTETLPDIVIVDHEKFTVILIDGTVKFQQWAMQAFGGIIGPQNNGDYSSYTFWFEASSYLIRIINESGIDPTKPTFIAAHSYGGVTAMNFIARVRTLEPDRNIRWLTFGDPKPGDIRMRRILERTRGESVVNDTDIITALPPDRLELFPVLKFLVMPGLQVWDQWIPEPFRVLQNVQGQLIPSQSPIIDFPILKTLTDLIILGQPFPTIAGHRITEYRSRILLRQPNPAWPISQLLWLWLLEYPIARGVVKLRRITSNVQSKVVLSGKIHHFVGCVGLRITNRPLALGSVGLLGQTYNTVGNVGMSKETAGSALGSVALTITEIVRGGGTVGLTKGNPPNAQGGVGLNRQGTFERATGSVGLTPDTPPTTWTLVGLNRGTPDGIPGSGVGLQFTQIDTPNGGVGLKNTEIVRAQGSVALNFTEGPTIAQGSVALTGQETNTTACLHDLAPDVFTVFMSAVGYPWNATSIQLTRTDYSDRTEWEGHFGSAVYFTSIKVRAYYADPPGVVRITWSAAWVSTVWQLNPQNQTLDNFTCAPWFFSSDHEIFDGLSPTGDFINFTVSSIP